MFAQLEQISQRPQPFEFYTAADLWTDEHTSAQMLRCHLDAGSDLASRRPEFVARSLDWLCRRFEVGEGTAVIDFGCGPGLYTNALARRGARVTGLDFSRRSLQHAREVAAAERLEVDYAHCNYLEFETEQRYDLVTLIFCDFCPLSPAQRAGLLRTFRRLLKPGGRVLLDVCSQAGFGRVEEAVRYEVCPEGGFWAPGAYYCFRHTFRYPAEQVSLDKYTIVERERTRTVYNWLQYFTPETLTEELQAAGLGVEELCGDVAGAPYDPQAGEFAVVAGAV